MTVVHTPSTPYPGKPFQRQRALWVAGGVFLLLIVATSICSSLPYASPPSAAKPQLGNPGQTETAAQQVLATVQAANLKGTKCFTGSSESTPYVAIWELFGTPTQTPTRTIPPVQSQ